MEEANPSSVLNHFKKMVQLRKTNEVLVYGKCRLLVASHAEIYAYSRESDKKRYLSCYSFSVENSCKLEELSAISDTLINNLDTLNIAKTKSPYNPIKR